jgi:hypothetical protein
MCYSLSFSCGGIFKTFTIGTYKYLKRVFLNTALVGVVVVVVVVVVASSLPMFFLLSLYFP